MRRRLLLASCALALLLAVLVVAPVSARDVTGLYRGEAEVTDRSAAELNRGASVALGEVLVKLTGTRQAAAGGAGAAVIKRATKLMLQYAYQARPDDNALLLTVEFDERALATELAALNVALWGKERPDSLVWLIIDRAEGRELVSGDEPGLIGEAVLERANRRGIPLLLPLMDIAESQHLSFAGDWEGLRSTALALSSRYTTPASLVGYLRQAPTGFWDAQWGLQIGEEVRTWSGAGDIVELMLEEAVDELADALAARYADQTMLATAEVVGLNIYGVRTASDYARVANYLAGLDTVNNLFVSGVNNQRVEVRFSARGGRAALAQSIAFGQVLTPHGGEADAYQLLP